MNDDLIRQAALASVKMGAKSDAEAVRNYREAVRHAEIAFAVFEEAHTPTDDCPALINEDTDSAWQAIADALGRYGFDLNSHEDTAEWVRQYLFRRPVSPEPSVSHNGIVAAYCPIHGDLLAGPRNLRCQEAPEGHEFMLAPEPQGEPTIRDHVRALTGVTDEGLDELGGFQGEPTDAQVKAALHEFYDQAERSGFVWRDGLKDSMRAALRAAAETTNRENGSEQ